VTEREELEKDALDIAQLAMADAWGVIRKRLGWGIQTHLELLLTPGLDPLKAEHFRQRVLAYRELLDLPELIRKQAQEIAPISDGEE
jgi:hypothetical protein